MLMNLKLWIDDIREPPDDTWDWVATSEAAIALLKFFSDEGMLWCPREAISFDHDLGGDDTTRPVVMWMIENNFKFDKYNVHSGSKEDVEWIISTLSRHLL